MKESETVIDFVKAHFSVDSEKYEVIMALKKAQVCKRVKLFRESIFTTGSDWLCVAAPWMVH